MDEESSSDSASDSSSEREAEAMEDDVEREATGSGSGSGSQHQQQQQVYLPGCSEAQPEELEHDSSAYRMLHAAQTGAPCLSFDIIRDSLGESRTEFPLTCYLVAGTQADTGRQNFLVLMKMHELKAIDEGEDEEEEEEEEDTSDPQLETVMIQHSGAVNRVRVAQGTQRQLVATWSEKGSVHVWDATHRVILLDSPSTGAGASAASLRGHSDSPLFSFSGHKAEGYGLAWSPTVPGRLASGDCARHIHIWEPTEEGAWQVGPKALLGHTESVEDIQWSPNEPSVFASCSVDQTVRIWDCRARPDKACMLSTHAHSADVNVISWNGAEPLLVSGGDDGYLKIWDLRQFSKGEAAAVFQHHSAAVTSVEWAWHDRTVFASAGADNQVVQWDLAVERDEGESGGVEGVPDQLLFIHQGQREVKELHWHPQLPGVVLTTALSGFNIFRTISV